MMGRVREADIRARLDDIADDPDPSPEDRALLVRLLTSFAGRIPPAVRDLGLALDARDAVLVRERAHALKGMAGNIGATRLAALFADLEDRARAGRLPDPAGALDAVHAEVALVIPIV